MNEAGSVGKPDANGPLNGFGAEFGRLGVPTKWGAGWEWGEKKVTRGVETGATGAEGPVYLFTNNWGKQKACHA